MVGRGVGMAGTLPGRGVPGAKLAGEVLGISATPGGMG